MWRSMGRDCHRYQMRKYWSTVGDITLSGTTEDDTGQHLHKEPEAASE